MMEPALQLALHGTAYRTGAVTSARRVLMSYELDGCAGDWQGPPWPAKGRQTGPFAADPAALGLDRSKQIIQRIRLFPISWLGCFLELHLARGYQRKFSGLVVVELPAPRAWEA